MDGNRPVCPAFSMLVRSFGFNSATQLKLVKMSLSQVQVDQFLTEGYTTVPHFFSKTEVAAMQIEVARWIESGLFRDVSTNPDVRQNYQLIPLHSRSPLFKALPFTPKVIDAVGNLIGHPVIKILDQSFYKPPQSGMGTSWHTDNAYFRLRDPLRGTAMWIAIHDGDVSNGTLKVVPGAFNEEFPHTRDPASDHHIYTELDESRAVHCELEAGGVVFFCFGTPHATGDNQSDDHRVGVGVHFVNRDYISGLQAKHWEQSVLSGKGAGESFAEEVASLLAEEDA